MRSIFFVLSIILVVACSPNKKDKIVYQKYKIVLNRTEKWFNYLDGIYKTDTTINFDELKGYFEFYRAGERGVYEDILFFKMYYDISDTDLDIKRLTKLMEKRDSIYYPFLNCNREVLSSYVTLYNIEKDFYNELLHIDSLINLKTKE
jgi:hypothetical protein